MAMHLRPREYVHVFRMQRPVVHLAKLIMHAARSCNRGWGYAGTSLSLAKSCPTRLRRLTPKLASTPVASSILRCSATDCAAGPSKPPAAPPRRERGGCKQRKQRKQCRQCKRESKRRSLTAGLACVS